MDKLAVACYRVLERLGETYHVVPYAITQRLKVACLRLIK